MKIRDIKSILDHMKSKIEWDISILNRDVSIFSDEFKPKLHLIYINWDGHNFLKIYIEFRFDSTIMIFSKK